MNLLIVDDEYYTVESISNKIPHCGRTFLRFSVPTI